MQRSKFGALALAVVLSLAVRPASAQISINFDGVGAPCLFGSTTPLTTLYNGLGVTFGGNGSILNQCSNFPTATAHSGTDFLAYNTSILPTTESILFATAQTGFSIWIGSTQSVSVGWYLSGSPVGSVGYAGATQSAWQQIAQANVTFDRVDIVGSSLMTLDDLSTGGAAGVVPEPATMSLLATGLVGMVGAGMKRRRKMA